MKKIILLLFCFIYFKSKAQVRIKTEDGQTIELRTDGTWKVVGDNGISNNQSQGKKPSTIEGAEVVKKPIKECEVNTFGQINFINNRDLPLSIMVSNIVKLEKNPNYQLRGMQNNQYEFMWSYPREEYIEVSPNSNMSIYNVRVGDYYYTVNENRRLSDGYDRQMFSTRGNFHIDACQEIKVPFNLY